MDYPALEQDLFKVLAPLPMELVGGLGQTIFQHLDLLRNIMPEIMQVMMPHVRAAALEGPAGMLDMEEIQKVFQSVIGRIMASHAQGLDLARITSAMADKMRIPTD